MRACVRCLSAGTVSWRSLDSCARARARVRGKRKRRREEPWAEDLWWRGDLIQPRGQPQLSVGINGHGKGNTAQNRPVVLLDGAETWSTHVILRKTHGAQRGF
jgi:hypothetical protein